MFYYRMNVHIVHGPEVTPPPINLIFINMIIGGMVPPDRDIVQVLSSCERIIKVVKKCRISGGNL